MSAASRPWILEQAAWMPVAVVEVELAEAPVGRAGDGLGRIGGRAGRVLQPGPLQHRRSARAHRRPPKVQ
eukprot:10615985-Lingulodinium_polyedra.AAC.1